MISAIATVFIALGLLALLCLMFESVTEDSSPLTAFGAVLLGVVFFAGVVLLLGV